MWLLQGLERRATRNLPEEERKDLQEKTCEEEEEEEQERRTRLAHSGEG